MLLWINQQTTTSWLSNFVVTMFLKKVALIKSSLFDKFKRDNFWAPFLKASEVTTKNGGGEGSISILVGSPYSQSNNASFGSFWVQIWTIIRAAVSLWRLTDNQYSNPTLSEAKLTRKLNFHGSSEIYFGSKSWLI